jgi:hypothetical protein
MDGTGANIFLPKSSGEADEHLRLSLGIGQGLGGLEPRPLDNKPAH